MMETNTITELLKLLPIKLVIIIASCSLAALLGLGTLVVHSLITSAMEGWKSLRTDLQSANAKLEIMSTNHLSHIEETSKRTVELLEDMHLDQKELIGFLKGKANGD